MTIGLAKPASDVELSKRIRAGERAAVRAVLERDNPVAALFARAVADGGSDPGRVVEDAWKWLLSEVAEGNVDDGMRAALLARVAQGLESRTKPTGTQQPKQPGTFVAAGDRWAGWWDQPPPDWPHGAVPQPEHVFSALRRLPVDLRALLILRDVGDVSAEDAAAIVPGARHQQQTALEQARDGYLVELDRVMVGSGDDRHQSDM